MNVISRPLACVAKLVKSIGFFLTTAETLDEFRYGLRPLRYISIYFVSQYFRGVSF